MECRFAAYPLGEIDSPRFGGAPCLVNRRGIGDPADAAAWEAGLVTPPLPPPPLPRTAMGAPTAVLGRFCRPLPPPWAPSPLWRAVMSGDRPVPCVFGPPVGGIRESGG